VIVARIKYPNVVTSIALMLNSETIQADGFAQWTLDAAKQHTDSLWALAERGVADRHSVWHTPTLATMRNGGLPDLRTVVLRAASRSEWTMRMHTDWRSAKAQQLASSPDVAMHVYDPRQKLQVRIYGHASLHLDDDIAEAAWAATRPRSRIGYAQRQPPGERLEAEPVSPAAEPVGDAGRCNFAVIIMRVTSIDWLQLAAAGHRRAMFARDSAGSVTGAWLAP
jgi:pyridoxamine 5'-phosphate oxidase